MRDRDELRQIAEAAKARKQWALRLHDWQTAFSPDVVLILLDAADRGDRAVELLRELRRWDVPDWESGSLPEDIDALLAEVDA